MSLWSRIRGWFGSESAQSRPTGGVADPEAPDTHSTTGTTPSDTFVGSPSGDDPGDLDGPPYDAAEKPPSREHGAPEVPTDSETPVGHPSEDPRQQPGGGA